MIEFPDVKDPPLPSDGGVEPVVEYVRGLVKGIGGQENGQPVHYEGVNIPREPEKDGYLQVAPCLSLVQGVPLQYVKKENQGRDEKDVPHHVNYQALWCSMYLYGVCLGRKHGVPDDE